MHYLSMTLLLLISLVSEISIAERDPYSGFKFVDSKVFAAEKHVSEIPNMPSVRSQDTVGMCASFAASAALDYVYCEDRKISCQTGDDSKRFSTFYLNTLSPPPKGITQSYGDPRFIMKNAIDQLTLASEACAPFDAAVNKIAKSKNSVYESQQAAWDQLQKDWEKFKKIEIGCKVCEQDFTSTAISGKEGVISNFNLKKDPIQVLAAFRADTFEKLVHDLFLPEDCRSKELDLPYDLKLSYYPAPGQTSNYVSTIEEVKKRVEEKIPVVVSGYCTDAMPVAEMKGDACKEHHAFLISGYKEVCSPTKCRELVKVHNSWGKEWQSANNGGWVDAKTLFDRTSYKTQSLSWITNPNREARFEIPGARAPALFSYLKENILTSLSSEN